MLATYISTNQFSVSGNLTEEFLSGRRVKANCGVDGYKYSTVMVSSFSSTNTVVTITENVLTSNLEDILYGIINVGSEGSLPNHDHSNSEGQGGELSSTILELTDTPSTYSGTEGRYLMSTGSGTEWVEDVDTSWFYGTEIPTFINPAEAVEGDFYYKENSGDLYERTNTSAVEVFNDSFTGTELNTSKWRTVIAEYASVTVDDVLQLNNTSGDAHSGAQCITNTTFPISGKKYIFSCKWLPSISDHYNAGEGPHIAFGPTSTTRHSYYQTRSERFFKVMLAQQGAFTTNRTELRLTEAGAGASDNIGDNLDSVSINIDETAWHDLYISLDFTNNSIQVLLDNTYTMEATISSSVLDSIGSSFEIEFGTSEYNKTNTEAFDDVVLSEPPSEPWTLKTNFCSGSFTTLSDTPSTYSGTNGMFLKSNGSEIVWEEPSGTSVFTGSGAPTVDIGGSINDIYIDSTENTIYEKTSSSGISDDLGVLLIHSDTTDGSTTFLDSSGNEHTISSIGVSHKTTEKVFGKTSIYFPPSTYRLTVPASSDFDFGLNDFTIDFWVWKYSYAANDYFLDFGINASIVRVYSGNLDISNPAGNSIVSTTAPTTTSDWVHLAITRASGVWRIFYDGIKQAEVTDSTTTFGASNVVLTIGNYGGGTAYNLDGYMDELRIVKGKALWTSNFDVPTESYSDVSRNAWDKVLETKDNFTDLEDTPPTYSGTEGQFLVSTGSGIVWTTISGVGSESSGGALYSGDSLPTVETNGDVGDFYIYKTDNDIYERFADSSETAYTAKSVIFDIADNYGASYYLGFRKCEFTVDGTPITLTNTTDFVAYASSFYSATYPPWHAFDSGQSKIGSEVEGWQTSSAVVTNTRIIIVFNTSTSFDGIIINNFHHNGGYIDCGAKNVKIYTSTDTITDTTYDAAISNSTKIFDGQFDQHVASNVADDKDISLTSAASDWIQVLSTPKNLIDLEDTPSTYSGTEGQYLVSTGSGVVWSTISGVGGDDYVTWDFGDNTISGTGNIYCNDIYTASGTVYIGDLKLSSDGENLLVGDNIVGTNVVKWYNDSTVPTTPAEINAYHLDTNEGDIYYTTESNETLYYEYVGSDLKKTQVTGSSMYSSSYSPQNLFDGNGISSVWISSAANGPNVDGSCWLQWNFGANYTIHKLRMMRRPNAGSENFPKDLEVYVSSTGSFTGEEQHVGSITLADVAFGTWDIWRTLSNPTEGSYLRIEIHSMYLSGSTYDWVTASEIEFQYGVDLELEWNKIYSVPTKFVDLEDVPTTYSGTEGQYLASTGSGVEWLDASMIHHGDNVPETALGNEGDYYLRTPSDGIYLKYGDVSECSSFKSDATAEGYTIGQENPSYTGGAFDNVVSSGDATGAWYAYYSSAYQNDGWTGQDFGSGNEKAIVKYRIYSDNADTAAKSWTFEASVSGTWTGEEVVLDTVSGYSFGSSLDWHEFTFYNNDEYRYYRLNVTENNGNGTYLVIREIEMMECAALLPDAGWNKIWSPVPEAYDEIVLRAPDNGLWALKVTNSGTLYTEAV